MRIACWMPKGYMHTLGMCNTYFFSIAKMVARICLNVTLKVQCLLSSLLLRVPHKTFIKKVPDRQCTWKVTHIYIYGVLVQPLLQSKHTKSFRICHLIYELNALSVHYYMLSSGNSPGVWNSEAGELPWGTHTTFRTRRKFGILILLLLYSDMHRQDNALFREYSPSLKQITVNWIALLNCIAFSPFCC
jgi:hypothetical protein